MEQVEEIILRTKLLLLLLLSCTALTACGNKANTTALDAALPVNTEALQYVQNEAPNVDVIELPNGETLSFVVPADYSRIDYGANVLENLLSGYAAYPEDGTDGVIVQWLWLDRDNYAYMVNPLLEELDGTGVVPEPEVATPFLTINGSESFLGIPVYNKLNFSVLNTAYPDVYLPDTFYLFGVSEEGSLVLRLQYDSEYTKDCVDFAYEVVNGTATVENTPDTFEYSEAYKTSLDSLASSLLEYTVYGDLEQIP